MQALPDSAARSRAGSAFIWVVSGIAALGGLLFGWDWVVIGGAKPFFERYFDIQNDVGLSGWANSCALIGCLIGALGAGSLGDRYGRKPLLAAAAMLFAITSLGNAFSDSFRVFVAWRICGGVAIGLASSLSPLYISEVSPAALRGRLVSINQLTIVIGILAAQIVDWSLVRHLPAGASDAFIAHSWYGQSGWRWMFALTALPALMFVTGVSILPESPRWLVKRGRIDEARRTLERIGGSDHARAEITAIAATLRESPPALGTLATLRDRRLRRLLALAVGLAVLQQWCGINVIFNYAEEIFRAAGYDISSVLSNIMWTGSVNLALTFVALGVVDRIGRRPLMLLGAFGLAVIYLLIGAFYQSHVTGIALLILVLAAIACYAVSLAPVTWVVIAEIFPNRARGAAMSISITSLWSASFILTYTFPELDTALGPGHTFWLYAVLCIAGGTLIWRELPEMKGRSLEDIECAMEG